MHQTEQSIAHAIEMHQGIFDHQGDVAPPQASKLPTPTSQLAVEVGPTHDRDAEGLLMWAGKLSANLKVTNWTVSGKSKCGR